MLSEQQVKLDLFHVLYIGLKYAADSILNTLLILHKQLLSGISALDISTGPLHFSDRRTSSGQYILSFTGPYGPPRYISGHQISNSAGPNDDKSQYVLFARAPVPHLGSFRAILLLQRDASVSRVGVGHVNQTH